MISQTYDLNLIPSQIPVTIHCSQYDDGSRTFVFNLYEGASAFTLPVGASATFSGVKPDGLGFQYGCSITGASQVSVNVALQMTAVAGDCPCKVTVYDTDSNVLGSALCVLDVERHPLQDDTVISDSDIPLVQEAVNWAAQFQPSDFVQKNQGVAQAGKVLGIGADGMVTPTDVSANIDAEDVGYDGIVPDSENVEEAIEKIYVRAITSYRMVDTLDTTMADEDFIPFKDESIGGAKNITLSDFVDTISPNFYRVTDSAETTIDDTDYVPFYDTSDSSKKRITWVNIVTKIKSSLANYFGRKFSQSNGKLSLLSDNNTVLDTVTLSPLATNTSYTDTNNIGATNVQSAVDKLSEYSEGWGTVNSTYLNGRVAWQKVGRVVSVYCDFTTIANLPNTDYGVKLISGLPPILCPVNWIKKWTIPATDNTKRPIVLGSSSNSAFDDTSVYSTGNGNVTSGATYWTSFTYICK